MEPIQAASDINDERILRFNGFLGLVLYNSFHEELSKFLMASYADLHFSSGMDLLLILCDAVPKEIMEELKPPPMTYVTGLSANITIVKRAMVVDELRRKFGINNRELPCLIFFSGAESKAGYRLPLGVDKSNYGKIFSEVCDAAHSVAVETPPPYGQSVRDYQTWREKCFERLFPLLRTMRLRLGFQKFVTQAPLGQIASALKIAHGG